MTNLIETLVTFFNLFVS